MCECRNKSFNYQLLIIILDRKKKPSEKSRIPSFPPPIHLSISLPRKKGWGGVGWRVTMSSVFSSPASLSAAWSPRMRNLMNVTDNAAPPLSRGVTWPQGPGAARVWPSPCTRGHPSLVRGGGGNSLEGRGATHSDRLSIYEGAARAPRAVHNDVTGCRRVAHVQGRCSATKQKH